MVITARTETDRAIAQKLESLLTGFTLYQENHTIQVITVEGVHVAYLTENSRIKHEQTQFDLTIKGSVCDVLYFQIRKEERKGGHGRALYGIIENFAKEMGCKVIQTVPSGQGMAFWPKMGFNRLGETALEKDIG